MMKTHIKKYKKIALALLAATFLLLTCCSFVFADEGNGWIGFQNGGDNNGVVTYHGSEGSSEANCRFAVKLSGKSVTPPLVIDGKLYVASGNKVYCLDRYTGKVLKESPAPMSADASYAMFPMACDGSDLLFVPVTGGRVQAVDKETLTPVWITERLAGESETLDPLNPVTYKDGVIYFGIWGDNTTYIAADASRNGNVTSGVKKLKWVFDENKYGYYWAGAFVDDRYVYFGSDSKTYDGRNTSTFYAVDKATGVKATELTNILGSIRTTPVSWNGHIYFATKAGRVYKVKINADGSMDAVTNINLGGEITTTPVIYDGRLYVGVKAGEGGGNRYEVIRITDSGLEEAYSVSTSGYPQGAPILSTSDRIDGRGTATVYYTYNAVPGGLYSFTDSGGMTSSTGSFKIFEPKEADQKQNCISQLAMDEEGTIYYTNDSGHLFAVERKVAYLDNVAFVQKNDGGKDMGAICWKGGSFSPSRMEYNLILDGEATKVKVNIPSEAINGELQLIANGADVDSGDICNLDGEGRLELSATVSNKGQVKKYLFHFQRDRGDAGLKDLLVTRSGNYIDKGTSFLETGFDENVMEYSTAEMDEINGNYYLWFTPLSSLSDTQIVTVDNVKDYSCGEEIIEATEEKDGSRKLKIVPEDPYKSVVLIIRSFSADKMTTLEYQVTLKVKRKSKNTDPGDTSGITKPAGNNDVDKISAKKPGKVKIIKVKKGKKRVTVQWKRLTNNVKGYQIEVKPAKKTKGAKVKRTKVKQGKKKTLKKTVKKLKKKTIYKIRVRAYNVVNGRTVYGAWSKTKKVKIAG